MLTTSTRWGERHCFRKTINKSFNDTRVCTFFDRRFSCSPLITWKAVFSIGLVMLDQICTYPGTRHKGRGSIVFIRRSAAAV